MTNERPENVWAATLPNGLRVRVLCKPDFQRSYAVFATCYGGADRRFRVNDTWTDTPAGVAHYLEHKLFDMPDGSDALLTLSENGADPNAFTSTNMTAYYFSCTDRFEDNLRTLLRFVSTPYFTDASVAKEQGIIAQEIRMGEDDPDRAVWRDLMRCLLARDGARDAVAGTVESIAQITPETLYTCHRAFYAPSNMVLCAVCQDTPERVAAIAAEILPPDLSPVPAADHGAPEDMTPAQARMRVELAVSAPQMLLGAKFRPAEKGEARLRQTLTAELALQAAFGEATAFYNDLYRAGLLGDDFGCSADYCGPIAMAVLGGESKDPDAVCARVSETVAQIARDGFDGPAFERARRAVYGGWLRGLDRFDDVCIAMAEGLFGGYEHMDAFPLLGEITAAECAKWLTETLAPERLALSVVAPKVGEDDADDDAVDTERGEVVLLDVSHEEANRNDRHDERADDAHHQHHDLGLGHDQAFHHELRCLHYAPAEHDGDGKEERVFCGGGTRTAAEHAADQTLGQLIAAQNARPRDKREKHRRRRDGQQRFEHHAMVELFPRDA